MRAGPGLLLGVLLLLGIPGRAGERLGARRWPRRSPCPGRFCCAPGAPPHCCASRQEPPDRGRCWAMLELKARPRGGRGGAVPRRPSGALAVSKASWFYIAVVLTCLLGICICFSCEKFRRWLLGLDGQMDELEREGLSGMTSGNESPVNVGTDPSTCHTVGLRPANSYVWWTGVNKRNPETEMTGSPQVPTSPGPLAALFSDSLV